MRIYPISLFVLTLSLVSLAFVDIGISDSYIFTTALTSNTWSDSFDDALGRQYSDAGADDIRGLSGDTEFSLGMFNIFAEVIIVLPSIMNSVGFPDSWTLMLEILIGVVYLVGTIQLIRGLGFRGTD